MNLPPARLYANGKPIGDLLSLDLLPMPGNQDVHLPLEWLQTVGSFLITTECDDELAELLAGVSPFELKTLLQERN